jgi:hypothetical protein
MSGGTFSKVKATDDRMYGPRGLVVCGYPPEEHGPLDGFLERFGGADLPVVFATKEIAAQTLGEILSLPNRSGKGEPSNLRRAMVLSGFTQKELHTLLMGAYRQGGLPDQLWATLTPISENWSLTDLLEELARESEAMKKQGPRR